MKRPKKALFTDQDEFETEEFVGNGNDISLVTCHEYEENPEEIAFKLAGESIFKIRENVDGREIIHGPKKKKAGKVRARIRIGREKPRGQGVKWTTALRESVVTDPDAGAKIGVEIKNQLTDIAQAIVDECSGSDAVWTEFTVRYTGGGAGKKLSKRRKRS